MVFSATGQLETFRDDGRMLRELLVDRLPADRYYTTIIRAQKAFFDTPGVR